MLERLNSNQMATFAACGFLRFDGRVPDAINEQFIDEAGGRGDEKSASSASLIAANRIPEVPAGTPLMDAYLDGTALGRLVRLPRVQGAIESLVGPGSLIDHHFLHVLRPSGDRGTTQHTH